MLGVISDTHDDQEAIRRASELFTARGAGLVLHLGDIVAPFSLRAFKNHGVERLIAVYGNNCGEKLGLRETAVSLGYEIHEWPHVLSIGGRRIIMVHGLGPAEKTRGLAESLARSGDYDIVLYGHTHSVDYRRLGGTLLLNPGEACGCLTGRRTIALLDTDTLEAEIIEI